MNNLTFRQWLSNMPRSAIREVRGWVGVGQIVSGVLIAILPSYLLWKVMNPYWLSPIIFVPLGVFLFVRGLWNCEKEDERDRVNK